MRRAIVNIRAHQITNIQNPKRIALGPKDASKKWLWAMGITRILQGLPKNFYKDSSICQEALKGTQKGSLGALHTEELRKKNLKEEPEVD